MDALGIVAIAPPHAMLRDHIGHHGPPLYPHELYIPHSGGAVAILNFRLLPPCGQGTRKAGPPQPLIVAHMGEEFRPARLKAAQVGGIAMEDVEHGGSLRPGREDRGVQGGTHSRPGQEIGRQSQK